MAVAAMFWLASPISVELGAPRTEETTLRATLSSAHPHNSDEVHFKYKVLHARSAQVLCLVGNGMVRPCSGPRQQAKLARGHQSQGARHVSETQQRNRRDRHRYRQELVPRRGP